MFFLETSDCQDTDARKTVIFLVEYSSASAVFLIEVLMEEMELVLAEILKFEYRANSN